MENTKERKADMEVAKQFWKNADMVKLAKHWKYNEKLEYEIQALSLYLNLGDIIWDAACGDHRISNELKKIYDVYCSDINHKYFSWDISDGIPLRFSDADVILLLGVIQFINDEGLLRFFEAAKDKKVIIRNACTEEDIYINKYSEELGAEYESQYRSLFTIVSMLEKTHTVGKAVRVYPSELESKFGTTQYLIVGFPR